MATKLQIRNDSSENWLEVNPILDMAEIGYETTTNKIKVGDGMTAWKELPYLKGESYNDTAIKQEISSINTTLEEKADKESVYTKEEIEELKYIDEEELASKNYMERNEALDKFNTKEEIQLMLEQYVPTTRTINLKPLNANIVLTAEDVNALPSSTSIPTKVSDLENDSGFLSSVPAEYVTETELKAKGYATTSDVNDMLNAKADKDSLATVATSGSYNDLEDKPVIPSEYVLPIASSSQLGGIKVGSGLAISVDGTLSSTTSGGTTDYTALSNKPQINSVELSGNKSLDDLGIQAKGEYALKSELANKADTSAIPTKVSQLQNDSNFLTSVPAEYVTETELNEKGFITESELNETYATKVELAEKADVTALNGKANKSTTLNGYGITDAYTKTDADGKYATKAQGTKADTAVQPATLEAYVTTETANSTYATKVELGNKADTSALDDYLTIANATSTYATKASLSGYATTSALEAKADKETTLAGYGITDAYTKTEADGKYATKAQGTKADTAVQPSALSDYLTIANATSTYATKASLSGYATTSALEAKADKETTLAGYGITDAYTKTEADGKYATKAQGTKADTAVQPSALSDYLTTETASSTYATKASLSGYVTTTELSTELDNYVTTTEYLTENEIQRQIFNRIYDGRDLTQIFANEIAKYSDEWAWIKARISAANYEGLYVGDYIPVTMNAGTVGGASIAQQIFQCQIAGIDTYTGCGDTEIGHHIDFISREVIDSTVTWNPENNNNGTSVQANPWLASQAYAYLNGVNNYTTSAYNNVAHGGDYSAGGILQLLPTKLTNLIVTKRNLLDSRYDSTKLLTYSTTWEWGDMGKLWLPNEIEVYGTQIRSNLGYAQGYWNPEANIAVAYPIYLGSGRNRIKRVSSGGRSTWWLSSAVSHNSSNVCHVGNNGFANGNYAANASLRCPLCFRIA